VVGSEKFVLYQGKPLSHGHGSYGYVPSFRITQLHKLDSSRTVGIYGQTLGPATYYFALLLLNAGITDTNMQRILNFVYT
jgi:hypothetical protein